MEYREVERYVGRPIYLESCCTDRWMIYKAYGTIESISPYVADFVPTQVVSCMNPIYMNISPLRLPTLNIDKICVTLTAEDMYKELLL